MCNKDLKDNTEPPRHGPALIATKVPATQQSTPSFMHSAWAVDEFLQLSDQEIGEKESPVGFGELEWFADIGLFHDETPKGAQAAAQVPELPTSQASNTGFHRANKHGTTFKKPRLEISDDEEYFTVPDIG